MKAGLPKKYAQMGFKKGWRLYKASLSKRKFQSKIKIRSVKKIVKRKKSSRARKVYRKAKSNTLLMTALGAGLYGAGRQYMSDKLAPLTNKIPLGEYSDEAGMLILNYALAKGKIPFINKLRLTKDFGKAGMTIEMARIGAGFAAQALNKNSTVSGSNQSFH